MRAEDLPAFFAELGAWTAATGPEPTLHRYGAHPDQVAELREPQQRPRGTAVVFHGGFWRAAFTRANTAAVSAALTLDGWRTWNVEYRRVGNGGGYPATLEDIRTCIASLAPEADVAVGHSAGAQLALWSVAERLVAAAASLAGVIDLAVAEAADLGSGAVAGFLGRPAAEAPDADPAKRLPLPGRVLVVHGDRDDRVPVAHSRAFAAAAGDRCRLLELEDAGHFDVIDPRAVWWPAIEEAVDALVS